MEYLLRVQIAACAYMEFLVQYYGLLENSKSSHYVVHIYHIL